MELTAEAEDALVALQLIRQGLMSEAKVERALASAAAASIRLTDHLAAEGRLAPAKVEALRASLDPEVVPGFRIEGEAGRGGMGVVYRARQVSLDRPVALKVLSRTLSEDEGYVAKFLAEARSAARLNHENVVAAIDAGARDGLHYFVMELIDGPSVADLLEDGPLPWERAFSIAEQVARGLRHAHEVGIVHRDVKPENVMIAGDQTVKLCDLGLAKPLQPAGTGEKEAMTEGTPYYCSPEQALGRTDIDARSDVYSLGTTLYHMLTGEPPFDGDSARAILIKQVKAPFPDLAQALPEVPSALRDLLGAMVVKDRAGRLADMRAFEERLAAARLQVAPPDPGPVATRPRRGALVGVASILVFAGLAAALSWGASPPSARDSGPGPEVAEGPAPAPEAPPPEAAPPEAAPAGEAALEGPAQRAVAEAAAYRAAHPQDVWGALERLRAAVALEPAGPAAEAARPAVAELEAETTRRAKEALERLAAQVLELTQQQRYRTAVELCEGFRATWSARGVPGLAARVTAISAAATRGAAAAATQALAALEGAEPGGQQEQAAEHLRRELPSADAERLRIELEAWRAERRGARWETALARYRAALFRGDLPAAEAAIARAEAQAEATAVAALRAEVAGIRRAGEVFAGTWMALTGQPVVLERDGGPAERGRLVRFDPDAWSVELEVEAGRVRIGLAELAARELADRALPPREGRLSALYFLGRGAPLAAEAALAAAVEAGQPDDPALRAAIRERSHAQADRRGSAWVTRWLADDVQPAARVAALRAVPDTVRSSAAYAGRFTELVAAYRSAREEQLRAQPDALFAGEVERGRRGRITVIYDFARAEQLLDWSPDRVADPTSRVELHADGGAAMWGKVDLFARWDDGELKVELRAVPLDPARPNASVVIASAGGWTGLLCAGGYAPPNVDAVTAPGGARRPDQVALPASLLAKLSGGLPTANDEVLDATSWATTGRAGEEVRVTLQRTSRGSLRGKVGTRSLAHRSLAAAAQVGAVAVAPLGSGLRVVRCEVTGRLDPAWLERAPADQATREAGRLPRPTRQRPEGSD